MDSNTPLTHQSLPIRLSLLSCHRLLTLVHNRIEQLHGKLSKVSPEVIPMGDINQPLLLLRSDVRGGGHPVCGIDKEQYQDFAVAGLLWIGELEGLDLVLVEVGECDAAICSCDHVPDFLHTWYTPEGTSLECTPYFGIRLDAIPVHII